MGKASVRSIVALAALVAIVGGCAGVASSPVATSVPSRALDKVTLRLDWFLNGNNSMYYLGKVKGFYTDEGIAIEIGEGKGSSITAQVVGSGGDMFGIADVSTAAIVADKGAPIAALASFVRSSPGDVTVLTSSGIKKAQDLKGKRIAAPAASNATLLLPAFLKANGMTLSDVIPMALAPTDTAKALVDGQVDGIADLTMSQAPSIAILLKAPVTMLKYADSGIVALSTGLIVGNDLLKKDPDLVKRFVRATVKSWQYAEQHPEELVQAVATQVTTANDEVSKAQFQAAVDLQATPNTQGQPFGWMATKDVDATVKTLQEYLGLSSSFDAKAFFVNDYLPH